VEELAVARALEEVDPGDHRIAEQGIHGEDQRTLHHAVDEKAMLGRVDVGDAAVMPLEMQAARRDHAVERFQGGARGSAAGRPGLRADERTRHLALVLGGAAVLAHARAGHLHRWRNLRRLGRGAVLDTAGRPAGRREQSEATFDEATLGFVHGLSLTISAARSTRKRWLVSYP